MPLQSDDLAARLRERALAGEPLSYLCFWGHRPRPDGAPSNSCFSQWYAAGFEIDGVEYATAEHYMMAEKARLFGDDAARSRILAAATPAAAKALGRRVAGFDDASWNAHGFDIVVRGNLAKFGQDARLRDFLCATGDQVLVEASPVDAVWGIGLAGSDPRARDPLAWPGRNLLGFALMVVRARLCGCGESPARVPDAPDGDAG